MAACETTRPSPSFPDRTARAWHIYKTDRTGETVVANHCQILDSGVLAFHNYLPFTDECVLVRAFSPRDWHDVALVDTPFAAPVHLHSPTHHPFPERS